MDPQQVCLVIPCYNEEKRLPKRDILDLVSADSRASVCLVDDGSADGTRDVIETLRNDRPDRIMVLALAINRGKAEAVRQGMLHASRSGQFGYIGYWDADLSTPLSELSSILAVFSVNPACRLVMGARVRRLGSKIERRFVRHLLGRAFSTLASRILHLPIYDSQCGAKVFHARVVETLFRDRFITRWLFDVEILARLRTEFGREEVLKTTVELPLRAWREVGGSKLRVAHMLMAPLELLKIRAHYKL